MEKHGLETKLKQGGNHLPGMNLNTLIGNYQNATKVFEVFGRKLHVPLNGFLDNELKIVNALLNAVRLAHVESSRLDWLMQLVLITSVQTYSVSADQSHSFRRFFEVHLRMICKLKVDAISFRNCENFGILIANI